MGNYVQMRRFWGLGNFEAFVGFLHSFIVCIFMTWREARFMVMTVSLTHLFSQLHIGLELYKYFFETVIGLQRLLSFWYVVQYIVQ